MYWCAEKSHAVVTAPWGSSWRSVVTTGSPKRPRDECRTRDPYCRGLCVGFRPARPRAPQTCDGGIDRARATNIARRELEVRQPAAVGEGALRATERPLGDS